MKVHELIETLKHAPPEAEVITEGCDCYGDIEFAVLRDGEVLLCRSDMSDTHHMRRDWRADPPVRLP